MSLVSDMDGSEEAVEASNGLANEIAALASTKRVDSSTVPAGSGTVQTFVENKTHVFELGTWMHYYLKKAGI